MNRLINKLFARKAGVVRRTTRPCIEALEDRWAPAVSVTTINGGQTLVLSGNGANDAVTIRDNADDNLLQVVHDGVTNNFQTSQINRIVVNLRGGADQFTYLLAGGSDFEFAKTIEVDLGAGNDRASINLANDGQGGEAKIEAPLALTIRGQAGNDQAEIRLGEIDDTNVTINALMGTGADLFRVFVTDDLKDDARLNINAFGQAGNDILDVLALDDIFVDDDAVFNVNLSGGTQNDAVRFAYDGELDGALNVRLQGDQGNDNVQAILTLDDDSDGTLQVRALGGAGNDFVRLTIADDSDGDVDILTALLDGGAGTDSKVSTANVTVINVP